METEQWNVLWDMKLFSSETGRPGTIDNPQKWSINFLTSSALHALWCEVTIKKNHKTTTEV